MGIIKNRFEAGNREEWLALRDTMADRVGGSEIGSIAGHNKYSSFLRLLEERVGLRKKPDLSKNIAVRLGQENEALVARMFSEVSGKKVHNENCIYTNDAYPHLKASIDRKIANEDSGLECKTAFGFAMSGYKPGDFPPGYLDQCTLYLATTGLRRWYLAILTNTELHCYLMTREQQEAERYAELRKRYAFSAGEEGDADYAEWVEKWSYLEAVYFLPDEAIDTCEVVAAHFIGCVEEVKGYMQGREFANDEERLAFLRNAVCQVVDPADIDGGDSTKDAIGALFDPNAVEPELVLSESSEDAAFIRERLAQRKAMNDEIARQKELVEQIENEIAMKAVELKAEVVKVDGWKLTYKASAGRRTAKVDELEKYFAAQGTEVPDGLISVSEGKASLRINEVKPKAPKGKRAA